MLQFQPISSLSAVQGKNNALFPLLGSKRPHNFLDTGFYTQVRVPSNLSFLLKKPGKSLAQGPTAQASPAFALAGSVPPHWPTAPRLWTSGPTDPTLLPVPVPAPAQTAYSRLALALPSSLYQKEEKKLARVRPVQAA